MTSLKDHRLSLNMSQPELAKKIGVSVRYIAMLEKSERTPSLKTARNLSKILKIPEKKIFLMFECTKSTPIRNNHKK